jgi:hypothetical protein
MLVLFCLVVLGHAQWVTRFVWRSDFFCATHYESYEASVEGVCWSFNTSEWRRARVEESPGSATRALVERFGDPDCTEVLGEAWSGPTGLCEAFGEPEENTFYVASVGPRPSGGQVLELQQYESDNCTGTPVRVTGTSHCVQMGHHTMPSWSKTECYPPIFVQHVCAVADCSSGCAALEAEEVLGLCAERVGGGSTNWGACTIVPRVEPPGHGSENLPGILPPLNAGALQGVAWGLTLLGVAVALG